MRKTATTALALVVAVVTALLLGQPASAAPTSAGTGDVLDARAAAGVSQSSDAILESAASWFSGTVAAGGTRHWSWNNAPQTAVYTVGFAPAGASTTAPCRFEAVRTWYLQRPGGEREFHFIAQNTGAIACGTTVLLTARSAFATWTTVGIDPGASRSLWWNNASPGSAAHMVGLSPQGATSTTPCQFEVTNDWYLRRVDGEREYHFTVKNVGSITCTADVELASNTTSVSWNTTLTAGSSTTQHWNNAPSNDVYVVGLRPWFPSSTPSCRFQVTREWYWQHLNRDGSSEREFYFTIKNIGSETCVVSVLLALA